jgi:hypothetical protein
MSHRNDDPPAGSARNLRANAPGIRVLTATVMTTAAFGTMAMFGGMSYAIASVHHAVGGGTSTPADTQYGCGSSSDRDRNGDYHSNCHTGSKGRGAGGDDKPGSKKG